MLQTLETQRKYKSLETASGPHSNHIKAKSGISHVMLTTDDSLMLIARVVHQVMKKL